MTGLKDVECLEVHKGLAGRMREEGVNIEEFERPPAPPQASLFSVCPAGELLSDLLLPLTILSPSPLSLHPFSSTLSLPVKISLPPALDPLTLFTVAYKYNALTAQGFLSSAGALYIDAPPRGSHTLTVQAFDPSTNSPLTLPSTAVFQIGTPFPLLHCHSSSSSYSSSSFPPHSQSCTSHPSTDAWYAVFPHQLQGRVRLRGSDVFVEGEGGEGRMEDVSRAAAERLGKPIGLVAATVVSSPSIHSMSPIPSSTPSCSSNLPRNYLLYRTPIHGLCNQKLDLMGAIAIAHHVNRTLVLPHLLSDLLTSAAAPSFVPFEEVFDVRHLQSELRSSLPGLCFATFDPVPGLETAPPFADSDVLILPHGDLETLHFYSDLFSPHTSSRFVMLGRPSDALSQFPVYLDADPSLFPSLHSSLLPSSRTRLLASRLAPPLGGRYLALHLRIEKDWAAHCARTEKAYFSQVKMCFSPSDIGRKLARFVAAHPDVTAVYLAVGGNVDAGDLASVAGLSLPVPIHLKSTLLATSGDPLLLAEVAGLTHLHLSSLDHSLCTSAFYFAGTSFSTFSNDVSRTLASLTPSRTSHIYNVASDFDGEGFVRRRDGGELVEPYDVVDYGARSAADLSDFLREQAALQNPAMPTLKNVTYLENPYSIARAVVGANDGTGVKRMFSLFATDDEAAAIGEFCVGLLGEKEAEKRESCEEALREVVVIFRRRDEEKQMAEGKEEREFCTLRLPGGFSVAGYAAQLVARSGGVRSDSAAAHGDVQRSLLPSMEGLGREVGTDKVTHHGYHRFYEKYFDEDLRTSAGLKIMEIGLAKGSSMNLWCGYFPTAVIVGVDVALHPDCQPCGLGEGVYVYSGDSTDEKVLRRVHGRKEEGGAATVGDEEEEEKTIRFDVIVDDGAHTPDSQISAFNYLFKHALEEGGTYFIEDIETSYWTRGELYGNEYGGGGVGRGGETGQNIVEVFKNFADLANREFFSAAAVPPSRLDLLGTLDWEAADMAESVEFGHNIIAVRKKKAREGGKSSAYYDREYRMRHNVEDYIDISID